MSENLHHRMNTHKIDDLFKSAIDSAEEIPDAEVWEGVEKKLDQYNLLTIKRKYNNLKGAAAALLLLLFSVIFYELQNLAHSKGDTGHSIVKNATPSIKSNRTGSVTASGETKASSKGRHSSKNPGLLNSGEEGNPPFDGEIYPGKQADQTQDQNIVSNKLPVYSIGTNNNKGVQQSQDDALEIYHQQQNSGNNLEPAYPSAADLLPSSDLKLDKLLKPGRISDANRLHAGTGTPGFAANPAVVVIKPGSNRSRFSLSLIFSPDFTSRVIKPDWQVNREDSRDEIKKSEFYAFSYSLGALVDYNINRHWAVQSGFSISAAVMNIKPKFIFARQDNVGEVKYKFNSSNGYSFMSSKTFAGPALGDSLHASGSSSSVKYVSLPVAVKYKFGKGRLHFNALAGAAANFLIKDRIETSLTHGANHDFAVNKDIIGLKPVYYSALVAAGATYNINTTLAVNFTPTARIGLTSINKDAPVKSYQQSLGMVAGVQFNF
jgi:hypothetical protein